MIRRTSQSGPPWQSRSPEVSIAMNNSLRSARWGWDNVLWRLGDELAVRMPRRPTARWLTAKESPMAPRVAERGLPALAAPNSRPASGGAQRHTVGYSSSTVRLLFGYTVCRSNLTRRRSPGRSRGTPSPSSTGTTATSTVSTWPTSSKDRKRLPPPIPRCPSRPGPQFAKQFEHAERGRLGGFGDGCGQRFERRADQETRPSGDPANRRPSASRRYVPKIASTRTESKSVTRSQVA